MRLIDADTLTPLFIKKAYTMEDRHGVKLGEDWMLNYNDIKDVIDNAPTVEPPEWQIEFMKIIYEKLRSQKGVKGATMISKDLLVNEIKKHAEHLDSKKATPTNTAYQLAHTHILELIEYLAQYNGIEIVEDGEEHE